MKFPKYYLAAITAFIIWGFFSLGLKPLHAYASLDILFYRIFFCVVLMLFINLVFRRKAIAETTLLFREMPLPAKKKLLALVATSSVLLTANWFFFIYVMNHISVKAASFAYLLCPIVTTIFAFIILKEKLSRLQWGAVSISMAGCILLSLNNIADVFYSIIVASSYALYLIIQKKITGIDKFLLLSVQLVMTAILLLPFYPVYGGAVPTEAVFYGYILIIAVVFTIIPLFLNLYSLKGISSSTVGIMLYINPIIGFLLSAFYYGEEITALQITAYSLIVVSIAIFNVGSYLRLKAAQ